MKKCLICQEPITSKRKDAVYCSNNCGRKAFMLKNPNKRKEYYLKYREKYRDNHNAKAREYCRKYYKTVYLNYFGVIHCPKCGSLGYASIYKTTNIKTKNESKPFLMVQHRIGNKTYKACYGGYI